MKKSTAVLLGMLASAAAVADSLHVPGDYPSVQAAINAAVDGDTVLVAGATGWGSMRRQNPPHPGQAWSFRFIPTPSGAV